MIFAYLFLMLAIQHSVKGIVPHSFNEHTWKCEPIHVDFCKGLGYNATIKMSTVQPNPFTTKESQMEGISELNQYKTLDTQRCSKHLRLLVCSVYLPFCHHSAQYPITACKGLCLEVKRNCIGVMRKFKFPWPENLDCSKPYFRVNNTVSSMCLDGGITSVATASTTTTATKGQRTKKPGTRRKTKPPLVVKTSKNKLTKITSGRTFCQVLYARNRENYFYVERIQGCALGCMSNGLFTFSEKQVIEKWLSALTCICVLLCMLALFVVFFDYHKTCYPERPIIFITTCFLFYSLAYVIRVIYGRENVTCREENGRRYLLIDGSGNYSCAATYLLSYCFSVAQNIWWAVLCLTWFLNAGMKWSADAVTKKSKYFHIVVWGVACAITTVSLVSRKIDVNELTGICSIGNRLESLSALTAFVLGPRFFFLVMGVIFLLFGTVALVKLPKLLDHDLQARMKSNRTLIPVVLYAMLHAIFSTIIVASYFYEYIQKASWFHDELSPGPSFLVFLLRIITDFFIGICSAIWLLTIHAPALYKTLKLKVSRSDLMINGTPDRAVLDPLRTQAGTNETSI